MAKKNNNIKKTDKEKKDVKNKGHFWKDFRAELKKVTWSTPKQLLNNTVAVIVIVLVTALIVFALDLGFEAISKRGINKLQTVLQSNSAEENATSENTTVQATTNNAQ